MTHHEAAVPGPRGWSLRRHLGLFAAIALTLACLLARDLANDQRVRRFDRHHLPGFDPYVYAAMAEDPAFFTVAPWGYRVLSPWLVYTSGAEVVPGFRRLSLIGLGVAGPLLFLFLRRQGASERLCLLATGLFFFSPPVDEVFRNFFLAEPVGLPLLLLALLALEAKADDGRTAALGFAAALALGALTKEVFIVYLPGLLAAAFVRFGLGRGLARTGPGALTALFVHFCLRQWWAPYPSASGPGWPSLDQLGAAASRILGAASDWWAPLFACGFPLAVVAVALPEGGRLLARYGVLLALTVALPFAAGIYTGGSFPADHFYTDDVPRLLIYAMPMLLALALVALQRLVDGLGREPGTDHAPAPNGFKDALTVASVLALGAAVALPLTSLDRYRRADLRGRTDGPFVLAFCRDSRAFARRLASGRPVVYDPVGRRFKAGRSDPRHMERMRWFLREGWGERPEYGMEEVTMEATSATLVVPVIDVRDLVLTVDLRAPRPVAVRLSMNGLPLGELMAGPEPVRQRLSAPRASLFRGDNRLTFEASPGPASRVSLWLLNLRQAQP